MTALVPEETRIQQIRERKNITFLGWVDGYFGNKSKARLSCDICNFTWSAKANNIISAKSGCPQCTGNRKWTDDDRVKQINRLDGVEFVWWPEKYVGVDSKVRVRCLLDGLEWNARVSNLVNHGTGCPHCKYRALSKRRRTNKSDLEDLVRIGGEGRYEFVRWEDENNAQFRSRVVLRCLVDGHEWAAVTANVTKNGTGCPRCSKTGFDPSEAGTLYALRSECGTMMKVGISNNPDYRHRQLARATPFTFLPVEQITADGVYIADLERHFHRKYKSAGLSGFDGATEWLVCTDELLHELRNTRDSLILRV